MIADAERAYAAHVDYARTQILYTHAAYAQSRFRPAWLVCAPGRRLPRFTARLAACFPAVSLAGLVVACDSLAEIRDLLPPGLALLPWTLFPALNIIEIWG